MALLEFYGETCPHCIAMKPLVQKAEEKHGVTIEKYEVWNSEENAEKMKEYDKGLCGGVPFFINTDNGEFLCGGVEEEEFMAWVESNK